MSVSERTVQRRIAKMEHDGLIQRIPRRNRHKGSDTNLYCFDGLIKEATPYAKEAIAMRADRKKRRAAQRVSNQASVSSEVK